MVELAPDAALPSAPAVAAPAIAPVPAPAPLPELSDGLLPLSKIPDLPPELVVMPPFRPAELRAPLTA
jgi:hypothetical protein